MNTCRCKFSILSPIIHLFDDSDRPKKMFCFRIPDQLVEISADSSGKKKYSHYYNMDRIANTKTGFDPRCPAMVL